MKKFKDMLPEGARRSIKTVERGARHAAKKVEAGVVQAANKVETTFVEKGTVRKSAKKAVATVERGALQAVQTVKTATGIKRTNNSSEVQPEGVPVSVDERATATMTASPAQEQSYPSSDVTHQETGDRNDNLTNESSEMKREEESKAAGQTGAKASPLQEKSNLMSLEGRSEDETVPTNYDTKFFSDWIGKLEAKIKPSLPFLAADGTFVDACRAVHSCNQTLIATTNARDEIAKQQSQNQPERNKANAAVLAATTALKDATDLCAKMATEILEGGDFRAFVSDSYDDSDLTTYIVLKQVGAKGLAEWCKRGDEEAAQLLSFLRDNADLRREFLQAGGARQGEYGRAIQLYHQLTQTAGKNPVLQRLALAVALELSSPLAYFGFPDKNVDPHQRYIHYEQAFLFGELDPSFESFTVWELRHAVNSDATNEEIGWGRQSLSNYRPDLVLMDDPQWRYCRIVRTDVAYKQPDWYKQQRSYDQILSGGGKCGPRAWYGRFACKAHGIPTWGARQPGHAAMTRWTTTGWMVCLGAGFQVSYWEGRCGLDFLLETQAREALGDDSLYLKQVMRLEWIACMHNENNQSVQGQCMPSPNSPWSALALMQRKRLVKDNPEVSIQRSCTPALSANNKIQALIQQHPVIEEPMTLEDGTIIIPAASTSNPTKETNHVLFPKSFLGGRQLVLVANSSVEYTLEPDMLNATPTKYQLTCRICTVHRHEDPLLLTISTQEKKSDGDVTTNVDMPYTEGMWAETEPVTIEIGGPGVAYTKLTLTRQAPQFAISMKDIKLVPL